MGYGSLPRNTPLLCTCYCAKFGCSSSDGTSTLTEFRWKSLDFAFHLSRSLKVVRTDTDQSATYDSVRGP